MKTFERFIPELSKSQRAMIATNIDKEVVSGSRERWLIYTKRRHAALIAFLRGKPDEAAITDYMVVWMGRPHKLVDPEFEIHADAWWDAKAELIWSLVNEMSPEQRAKTVDRMRVYVADIVSLI